jgi:hypothetical protein
MRKPSILILVDFYQTFNATCFGWGRPISLRLFLIPFRNSMQIGFDEDPSESSLMSIRNSIQHALEEETQILLQSVLIFSMYALHNDLKEEGQILLESLVVFVRISIQHSY